MDFEMTPADSEVSVTVSEERLWKEVLGNQGILDAEEDNEYYYLAALALECRTDDDYSIEDVMVEVLRHCGETKLTREEINQVATILEQ